MAVCLWVVFDSICNSVFKSQVFSVAKNFISTEKYDKVIIASFEKNMSSAKDALMNMPQVPGLEFQLIQRGSILSSWMFQKNCTEALLDLLYAHKPNTVITRGAIATVITKAALGNLNEPTTLAQKNTGSSSQTLTPAKSIGKKYLAGTSKTVAPVKPNVIVQARGLMEKEFLYNAKQSYLYYFNFIFYTFLAWQYRKIEKKAYDQAELKGLDYSIEVVTTELAEYLEKNFNADMSKVYLSTMDTPKHISKDRQKKNSESLRAKLDLVDKTVYVFSGSYKPWQCPTETLAMYNQASADVPNPFLLILTHDTERYEALAKRMIKTKFLVLKIEDQEQYAKLLSACNYGLIYRKDHIVNRVSRPVKAMDYFAAGLEVVHNNTVPWIIEKIAIREKMKKNTAAKKSEFSQKEL